MSEIKVIELQVKSNLDKTTGEVNNLNNSLKNTKNKTEDISKSTNGLTSQVDMMTGGAITKFRAFTAALDGAALGFRGIGTAIALSGLGLIVITIAAITAAFKSSEEGQNKFAKIMGVIGALTGNLVDLLADLGEKIISVFENPIESLNNFSEALKKNIINRFEGMLELIPAIGKALNLAFKRDFEGAGKVAVNALGKITTGVENVTDKVNGLVKGTKAYLDEQKKEMKLAGQVADMRAKSEKIERKLLVDRAALEANISELKLKSREIDKYSAQERAKFLKDATGIEDKLLIREQESLNLKYEAQKLENTFSRTNKENLNKEAQAQANLLNIQTRRNQNQKATLRELNRVNGEVEAENLAKIKAIEEAEKESITKRFELERLSFEERRKIVNEDKKLSLKDRKDFLDKINSEERKSVEDHKKAIADLNKRYDEEEENRLADTAVKKEELDYTRKVKEIESIAQTELEKQTLIEKLDTEHKARMTVAAKTDADKKAADTKAAGDKEIEIAKQIAEQKNALQNSQLNAISAGIGLLAGLAGKNKDLQKAAIIAESAMGIARSIISTTASNVTVAAQGAALAIPTSGASVIAAGKIIAANNITTGIGIAANIAATAKALSAVGGGSAPSGSSVPSGGGGNAPQFNVVGATGVNQLAGAIAGKEQAPVQAYVVANNVTTAQSLDRNIIRSATLG
jgi:hypothetical protein